jgi:hypothetical protein
MGLYVPYSHMTEAKIWKSMLARLANLKHYLQAIKIAGRCEQLGTEREGNYEIVVPIYERRKFHKYHQQK